MSAQKVIDSILEADVMQKKCKKCRQKYGRFLTHAQMNADQGTCPSCWRKTVDRIKDYLETGDEKKLKLDKDKKERKDYARQQRQTGKI